LVGGEPDQVESMWGQTHHGAKPAATILSVVEADMMGFEAKSMNSIYLYIKSDILTTDILMLIILFGVLLF